MADIDVIKREIRENQSPYFEDADIEYYLNKNNGNVENTMCYGCSFRIFWLSDTCQ